MTGTYAVAVTCPIDGAPVEHVTVGTSNGRETRGIARCTRCRTHLLVAVTITICTPTTDRALARHTTPKEPPR